MGGNVCCREMKWVEMYVVERGEVGGNVCCRER